MATFTGHWEQLDISKEERCVMEYTYRERVKASLENTREKNGPLVFLPANLAGGGGRLSDVTGN